MLKNGPNGPMNTVVTDLIDADHAVHPAQHAGSAGVTKELPSDDIPTAGIPVVPAPPAFLPPPALQALPNAVLPPPPSTPRGPAPTDAERTPPAPLPTFTAATSADSAPTPTDDPPAPALVTGPAAVLSADPAFAPLEQSMPALPPVTAVKPAPPPAAATPLTLEDLLGQQSSTGTKAKKKKKQGSSFGRLLGRLVMLGILVSGGYAAYTYGPDLYEQHFGGEEVVEGDPAEVDAPLAFPNATPAAAPIRTAEFVLEGLPGAPDLTYRVTTDFQTNVSQVDVTRPTGPDLQILTYGEVALIRRSDGDQWYQLERGRFPLDDRLERADWVRRLDELLPTSIRSSVTIDDAGETTVSGVPTRRLSLSLDVAMLGGDAAAPVDGTVTVDQSGPVEPAAPVDGAPAPVPPAAVDPTTSLATSIEIWVDAQGIVRKVSGVPQLGAETITVVRTDSAAWVPNYPTPEFVQPLTASALVELGI